VKVISSPYTFIDGDVLDPRDLNRVWKYKQEALADAASRRYIESAVSISFAKDCATGYSNSDSAGIRTFTFKSPFDVYVTRAFLNGEFSAKSDEVVVYMKETSSGNPPDGCTVPWLSISADEPLNEEVRDVSPARFKLAANTQYEILLDSAAAFTASRLDLTFHVLSDRFAFGPEPSFSPTIVNEFSSLSQSTQSTNSSNFSSAVSGLTTNSYAPVCLSLHNVSTDNTSSPDRRIPIPRIGDSRATPTAVSISFQFKRTAGTSTAFYARIVDAGGTPLGLASLTTASTSTQLAFSTINVNLHTSTDSSSSVTANDYFLEVASAASATLEKAFVMVWIK